MQNKIHTHAHRQVQNSAMYFCWTLFNYRIQKKFKKTRLIKLVSLTTSKEKTNMGRVKKHFSLMCSF